MSKRKLEVGGEEYKQAMACMEAVQAHPDADPFMVPVDWRGLNLPDYPKIVKKPMDLGTILEKLDSDKYTSLAAFATDVRLVWGNAQRYNQPGSGIYSASENLSAIFEEHYAKVSKKSASSNKRYLFSVHVH